ncbi:hypothetical protein LTR35_001758 [Friedmanniomyces endolithicus]|uniref:Dihydrofolate reductase n=1 Tax=Friedmanniomyces endolithicus TaxID=329885 RepID=A0AAN6FVV5_9PEZI|nr:hypothetical protein LTR35_001758 [Friedmanniomyces endolithicus]KAK0296843.1 hypothetical protein LTS00_004643 [Friedmanniomyces endolithicus]KAK0325437.1 hypothetical protein LTR82_003720 [Friedmanniomyces endolithicus]KAK1011160.1 hypothetical protein LTR54_005078 [Friedmanniomyces endolithicus]
MSVKQLPLTLIVAATPKNGIGKNGALPWPMLKKEMAYFARVTKHVLMPANTGSVQSDAWKQANLEGTRRNVVIMGRKTWESIPPKFRPLKDRTNIVISSQDRSMLGGLPEEVLFASDIMSGLEALEQRVRDGRALSVGRAFVIGGSSIYKSAMELPQTKSVLMTRINKDYECDTFFSEDLEDSRAGWQLRTRKELQEYVHEDVSEEPLTDGSDADQVSFRFQLYQRP